MKKFFLFLIPFIYSLSVMAVPTQYCKFTVDVYPASLSVSSDFNESEIKNLGPEFFQRLEASSGINPVTEQAFFAAEAAIIDGTESRKHSFAWNMAFDYGEIIKVNEPIVVDCTSEHFFIDVLMQNYQSDYTILKISRLNSAQEGIDSRYFIYKNELTGFVNERIAKTILVSGDGPIEGFVHNY